MELRAVADAIKARKHASHQPQPQTRRQPQPQRQTAQYQPQFRPSPQPQFGPSPQPQLPPQLQPKLQLPPQFQNTAGGGSAGGGASVNAFDAGEDDPIPPRAWLLDGTFCRNFISALLGDGGVGKTALRVLQYMAVATGRPLTGEHVYHRARVLFVCLEDDLDEVRRRIRAARLYHGISAAELKGWLYVVTPAGLKLVKEDKELGCVASGRLDILVRRLIAKLEIDVVGFAPFVKSHAVDENDNNLIDPARSMGYVLHRI